MKKETKEYIEYIDKRHRVYKLIPCISHIYLANSLTFNAIKKSSDIDLFIITYKDRIRTVRLRTLMLFSILRIKRGIKTIKKFCLSFYITPEALNLYPIKIREKDVYLAYRIAHLVPLYTEKEESIDIIRDKNKHRLQQYLPNHPMKQTIKLGNKIHKGINKNKKILNIIHKGQMWNIIELIAKAVLLPRTLQRKKKLSQIDQKNIIISNKMLKFHKDKREKIQIKLDTYNSEL